MLKRRLIPKLQFGLRKSFRGAQPVLVVTRQFGSRRAIGDPLSQAKIYEAQLADELILVDLERTDESWPVLLDTVELVAESLATPLAVGGGVRSVDQVQALLDRGADKVVLNSAALEQPELIGRVATSYGAQCVVLSLDARPQPEGGWRVWSEGGNLDVGRDALQWAREAVDRGAGEVMVTAIERDGTGAGLDLDLTAALAQTLVVPVIASGGCGLAQHFVDGYEAGAAAVAAGTFFCQRDQNPMQCRSHIRNAGLPIRLEV
ncbi:imidazole glycerol phosphate synthase subunit HisF [Synechococcus sp. MIT S9452]|uniref:imidazole glycerol phosphate synthase subunit HisF n=1 Tax=Synechococcus sp. MIT S9452 TaxID=3082546 RepID=UPI0039A5F61D